MSSPDVVTSMAGGTTKVSVLINDGTAGAAGSYTGMTYWKRGWFLKRLQIPITALKAGLLTRMETESRMVMRSCSQPAADLQVRLP